MNKALKPYLFLFFGLGLMLLPMSAFARSTTFSPVRVSFELSVIEASKTIDIRLANGTENLISDVCALASTKPNVRFLNGLADVKTALSLKFPDHKSFKLLSEAGIYLSEDLFGELTITDDPSVNLHLSYLGAEAKTGLHTVVLKLNEQHLATIKLKVGETFYQVGIPYGKGTLILAITLTGIFVPIEDLAVVAG